MMTTRRWNCCCYIIEGLKDDQFIDFVTNLCSHDRVFSFLRSIDGIDIAEFDCVYSPAKRRGPIPGRAAAAAAAVSFGGGGGGINRVNAVASGQVLPSSSSSIRWNTPGSTNVAHTHLGPRKASDVLQQRHHSLHSNSAPLLLRGSSVIPSGNIIVNNIISDHGHDMMDVSVSDAPALQRAKVNDVANTPGNRAEGGIPWTVMQHTHLLDANDANGERLRSYFRLSINELFNLPPTPSDEEYFYRILVPLGLQQQQQSTMGFDSIMDGDPRQIRARIPGGHLAALAAARFAELTLGAIAHHEVALALELGNAIVHCLREAVQTTIDSNKSQQVPTVLIHQIAKAYFLLGVFRAYRADFERYFQYRRVCLGYLSQVEVCAASNFYPFKLDASKNPHFLSFLLPVLPLSLDSVGRRKWANNYRINGIFRCLGLHDVQCQQQGSSECR
jgi:hypothetical protein